MYAWFFFILFFLYRGEQVRFESVWDQPLWKLEPWRSLENKAINRICLGVFIVCKSVVQVNKNGLVWNSITIFRRYNY